MACVRWLVARTRPLNYGALLLALTIIGIPFAWAHLKLAGVALWPVGKIIVPLHSRPIAPIQHEPRRLTRASFAEISRERGVGRLAFTESELPTCAAA